MLGSRGRKITDTRRTDFDLLNAWRAGDKKAGNELVRRHNSTLYRFFKYRAPEALADLTQATFLACVESRDRAPAGSFGAYLLGIARHKLLHYLRKRQREDRAYDRAKTVPMDSIRTASRAAHMHQQQRMLLTALRGLPMDLQLTIELHYWEGLTLAEVAQVLEIPEGTVKSRLNRARAGLRDRIAALAESPELRKSTLDNLERWARSLRDVEDEPLG